MTTIRDATAAAGAAARGQPAFLGTGLLRPLQRDAKNDFASGTGVELVGACVGQVLGTRATSAGGAGELPWRPEFGSRLHLLRHKNNRADLGALALVMVGEALRRWEPRARATRAEVLPSGSARELRLRVVYDIVDRGGRTLASDREATASVPLSAG